MFVGSRPAAPSPRGTAPYHSVSSPWPVALPSSPMPLSEPCPASLSPLPLLLQPVQLLVFACPSPPSQMVVPLVVVAPDQRLVVVVRSLQAGTMRLMAGGVAVPLMPIVSLAMGVVGRMAAAAQITVRSAPSASPRFQARRKMQPQQRAAYNARWLWPLLVLLLRLLAVVAVVTSVVAAVVTALVTLFVPLVLVVTSVVAAVVTALVTLLVPLVDLVVTSVVAAVVTLLVTLAVLVMQLVVVTVALGRLQVLAVQVQQLIVLCASPSPSPSA